MACCLTTQSHCMNQCRLIISKVLWHPCVGIIINGYKDISQDKSKLKIAFIKSPQNLTGTNGWMQHNLPLTGFTVEVVADTLRLEYNRWYFTDIFKCKRSFVKAPKSETSFIGAIPGHKELMLVYAYANFQLIDCASFGGVHVYPRPVLAFGYCHCLRLCVCPCVYLSVSVSITCLSAR